ncbi:MAG: hypothetical protein HY321_04845 [Armatimonadetes bacterium]|nr:hypothetical protein [Armatimonadota bacterium]
MADIHPPRGRAQITDPGGRLQVAFPIRPPGAWGWVQWLVLTLWLGVWAIAEVMVGGALLHRLGLASWAPLASDDFPLLFVALWFFLWTLGGGMVGHQWLQWLLGCEEVIVAPDRLTLSRRPLGLARRFRTSEVARLRVVEGDFGAFTPGWPLNRPGRIAFDYGAETVRFGPSLTPAEAQRVVDAIKARFAACTKPALP